MSQSAIIMILFSTREGITGSRLERIALGARWSDAATGGKAPCPRYNLFRIAELTIESGAPGPRRARQPSGDRQGARLLREGWVPIGKRTVAWPSLREGLLVSRSLMVDLIIAVEQAAMDLDESRPLGQSLRAILGARRRRQRRRSLPPSILLVPCGTELHRLSLPERGPIVLLDHPDRQLVKAMLTMGADTEGCLDVLRRVRDRSSNNGWGWYMWLVHVAPSFGKAGSTVHDRLKEFDQRRKLRRLLRGVDLG
jgi:hypothetical protein